MRINRIFGIPLPSYFDDFGAFFAEEIARMAIAVFTRAAEILQPDLKGTKSRCDRTIDFLGIAGNPPHVDDGMLLRIYLHAAEIARRSSIIDEVILEGRAQRKFPEKLIGRFSPLRPKLSIGLGGYTKTPIY